MVKSDIVIVGAGIAGLTAAIYLKRANANFTILEGKFPGGKLNDLKTIENFPSYSKTTGNEILISLMDQVKNLGIKITYGNVQTILKEKDGFEVVSDTDSYDAKAVIVATGQYAKGTPIDGELEFAGQGVSYCAVCDGNFFKNMDVAVYGNNNIALEESLYLLNLVNKLYFVCPNSNLEGDSKLINLINNNKKVEVILDSEPVKISGDIMGVNEFVLKDRTLKVSGVFPYSGEKSSTQILKNLNPEMNGIYVKTDLSLMSNVEGLFIAGDLADKPLRQLITASSDGATAAMSAIKFISK